MLPDGTHSDARVSQPRGSDNGSNSRRVIATASSGAPPANTGTDAGCVVRLDAERVGPWLLAVDDVDAAFQNALSLGASEVFAPTEYPGGKFAIVTDPQGASFGLVGPRQA